VAFYLSFYNFSLFFNNTCRFLVISKYILPIQNVLSVILIYLQPSQENPMWHVKEMGGEEKRGRKKSKERSVGERERERERERESE
jgi:hypothetical protein